MSIKNTIVVCDDESQIRKILTISLESADYKVVEAENGRDAITQVATSHPQLVILDLGLPDRDGLSVLKEIRTWTSVPVIILSVKNSEEDIVKALDLGADDYLTKPFNTSELLARIRANIRRTIQGDEETVFQNGDLVIDLASRIVKKANIEIKLTNTEYLLLVLLAKNTDKVLTHRYILKEIWGPSSVENSQYLRVFIGQLRKKIEDDYSNPGIILTESGIGYRMKNQA
ncbi:MAG TPA: response regulator transcription factor [Ignavibacteriaceae bacterium]|nr:response regulator transcription factor [Ignavibacteriaceae bacterium]